MIDCILGWYIQKSIVSKHHSNHLLKM
uniref:Uncharacterized protein n=1 Tax=Nelumbo nucifera TaxID=4432 RepID=A0A823A1C0_NELNU|nr:TPA_asm: hypothetical protein HUJ06_018743 [Nelumbo nucifera]